MQMSIRVDQQRIVEWSTVNVIILSFSFMGLKILHLWSISDKILPASLVAVINSKKGDKIHVKSMEYNPLACVHSKNHVYHLEPRVSCQCVRACVCTFHSHWLLLTFRYVLFFNEWHSNSIVIISGIARSLYYYYEDYYWLLLSFSCYSRSCCTVVVFAVAVCFSVLMY